MYTSEKATQCLVALLKAHGVRKIIASPGTTNHVFVGSIQSDPWFEVYSSVDERSAAYIACGMAAESGEPVVITCTGATASRNYLSGLTEAYYRKLPVIAVTYNAGIDKKGHLIPQQIDRDSIQKDVARCAVNIPKIKDQDDMWLCNVEINKALLALKHKGGGPVHINITSSYSRDFSTIQLPEQRVINRILPGDNLPELPSGRTAIIIGSHRNFDKETTEAIDKFCYLHNAVVFCDHTSGYHGTHRVQSSLIGIGSTHHSLKNISTLIHLGEISGDYYTPVSTKCVWRVCPDGEIKDTYRKLRYVFEMNELEFFSAYSKSQTALTKISRSYLEECDKEYSLNYSSIPDLPFGNIWIAKETVEMFPAGSVVHLGILNSLRSWNFFKFPKSVETYCNVGGFGIDGPLSTLLGASLANPNKLYFGIVGDLAFFYDLNVLGNRHKGANIRILLINNGRGTEFTNFNHPCHAFGEAAVPFMAAAGHFGNKSKYLVKHLAEDLGFEYMTASCKEDYLSNLNKFVSPEITIRPIIFEVFTDSLDESSALECLIKSMPKEEPTISSKVSDRLKHHLNTIIGDKGREIINIIRK